MKSGPLGRQWRGLLKKFAAIITAHAEAVAPPDSKINQFITCLHVRPRYCEGWRPLMNSSGDGEFLW